MSTPFQFPDLPSFQVVQPNDRLSKEDILKSTLPDGTKMVGPDGLLVPPARSFNMIVNSAARMFSYRFDEAMRDNFVNARAMKRDAFLLGLFEERVLPTINREWVVEVDDDRDPYQRFARDEMTKLVRAIPDFSAFKRALLEAVWFGRAGVQWFYNQNSELNDYWTIAHSPSCKDKKWDPIHGDSVQYTFDGIPAILLDGQTTGWYSQNGATWGSDGDLNWTDRGGTALVLRRPYWRDRFAIHQHIRSKADYFEGELAGSVQGLGLRGQVYWQYVIRTDALTWMLAYMQSVGQMDLLVFNYPAGDAAAQQRAELNANQIIGKAAIICPRNPTGTWPAVEQIQMNSAGLKAMHELVSDYFDRHIERLFVGQSMSSGADHGTGLGGTGRAEFCKATKDEILVHDTKRLDETITNDVVRPLKHYNFPWAKFPIRIKSVLPDLQAQEKVKSGQILISMGIPIKAHEYMEAAGFSRPEEGDEIIAQLGPGGPPVMTVMGEGGPTIPGMAQPGVPYPQLGQIPNPQTALQPNLPPPLSPSGPQPVGESPTPPAVGQLTGRGAPMQLARAPRFTVMGQRPNRMLMPPTRFAESGAGTPPVNGPVMGTTPAMGYPGGGNTYLPRFGRKPSRRQRLAYNVADANLWHPDLVGIFSTMTPTAVDRVRKRIAKFTSAPDVGTVTSMWREREGIPVHEQVAPTFAFFDPHSRELVAAATGANVGTREAIAHELGHVIDNDEECQYFDLSGTPEFLDAWRRELAHRQLSTYASKDEIEGFAEVARHLYGSKEGAELIKTKFPLCHAFFANNGLV